MTMMREGLWEKSQQSQGKSQICEFRQLVTSQLLTAPAGAQEHNREGHKHKASTEPGPVAVGSLKEEQPAKKSEGEASGKQERGENCGIPKWQIEKKDFKNNLLNRAEMLPSRPAEQGGWLRLVSEDVVLNRTDRKLLFQEIKFKHLLRKHEICNLKILTFYLYLEK